MIAHSRPSAVAGQPRRQPDVGQHQDAVAAFEDATDVINRPTGWGSPSPDNLPGPRPYFGNASGSTLLTSAVPPITGCSVIV